MMPAFFALSGVLPRDEAVTHVKNFFATSYAGRGRSVVEQNLAAVERAVGEVYPVPVPAAVTATAHRRPTVPADAPDTVTRVTARLLAGEGRPAAGDVSSRRWHLAHRHRDLGREAQSGAEIPYRRTTVASTVASVLLSARMRRSVPPWCLSKCSPTGRTIRANLPVPRNPEQGMHVAAGGPRRLHRLRASVSSVCPAVSRPRPGYKAINLAPIDDHSRSEKRTLRVLPRAAGIRRAEVP